MQLRPRPWVLQGRQAAGGPGEGRERRQVKRFISLSAARALAAATAGVWLIVAAHRLSLPAFGDLSILLALGAIFVNISDGGLQIVIADHVARAGALSRPVMLEGVRRRLGYAAICTVVMAAMYLVAASDKDPVVPLLFAGSLLGTAVYQLCLSAYRARGHVAADAANDVLSRIGVLVVGTVVLGLGAGLVGAAGVYGAADVVSAVVVLWFISTRHSVADDHVAPPDLRIRSTAVLGFAVTVWLVYLRIDGYLVGLLVGSSQAGLYGAAYRFLDVALLPALVLNHTILAHAAPLQGRTRLAEVNRFLRLALAVTVPLCIAGALLAEPIIHLLFPASFEPAIPIARVLMISAVPGAVAAVLTPLAGVSDRHRFAWAAVFVLVVNVGVDLVVIPRYLAIGAAWATVGCQILLGGLLYEIVRRDCVAKS